MKQLQDKVLDGPKTQSQRQVSLGRPFLSARLAKQFSLWQEALMQAGHNN